ncbi:hypothetical protein ACIF6H_37120 [Streptomyces microflavus]|uniref:hypothetical protein n=1 Tax=Streptomyces microflavus TaxID=1919 RepID=UPI003427462F
MAATRGAVIHHSGTAFGAMPRPPGRTSGTARATRPPPPAPGGRDCAGPCPSHTSHA